MVNALDALRTTDHITDKATSLPAPEVLGQDHRLDFYHIKQRIERYEKYTPWELLKEQISTHLKNKKKKA